LIKKIYGLLLVAFIGISGCATVGEKNEIAQPNICDLVKQESLKAEYEIEQWLSEKKLNADVVPYVEVCTVLGEPNTGLGVFRIEVYDSGSLVSEMGFVIYYEKERGRWNSMQNETLFSADYGLREKLQQIHGRTL
jgi:hypothetical protein